jgi:hypothetical protein
MNSSGQRLAQCHQTWNRPSQNDENERETGLDQDLKTDEDPALNPAIKRKPVKVKFKGRF